MTKIPNPKYHVGDYVHFLWSNEFRKSNVTKVIIEIDHATSCIEYTVSGLGARLGEASLFHSIEELVKHHTERMKIVEDLPF